MKYLLTLVVLLAGCQATPTTFALHGKVVGVASIASPNYWAFAVQTDTGVIPIIVVERDNCLDKKTLVRFRTLHSNQELLNKRVTVFGLRRDGHYIATSVYEDRP
jgi:hypothetical protein